MATILLSAAGAALGSGFGGTVLGLSGAVIGRAVGATLGRVIDQRLMGAGSATVETGKVERFRVSGASEGAPVGRVWGRMRVAGQIIWASRFREVRTEQGGGKGAPQPTTVSFTYTVSLAVALCEGEIARIGRVWADGMEIAPRDLTMRVYTGSETQLPDPKIEAVEGAGQAPAYRGTAYVVIEGLPLQRFGNRVPQLSFEVVRPARATAAAGGVDLPAAVRGVALIPGSGEYTLATTPVRYVSGPGRATVSNVHTPSGQTDFATSLAALNDELPACTSALLVVSWFGSDLRCGQCRLRPKVEQGAIDGTPMAWRAGGIGRGTAQLVPRADGRPVYGGTPADASVIEAIVALRESGKGTVLYPFVLMDQLAGNTLTDPWTGETGQPALPWRGRITLSRAPGRPGSPDRTVAAEAEVAAFFGDVQPGNFAISGGEVVYSGAADWGYRRFILHYAWLCKAAGGVDAFCIGSELRGLTQIRGAGDAFAAVAALRALANDVRAVLGPSVKIGYAADWTEYWGYDDGAGNRYFHLDPLWGDPAVDFIGIDNYMPISDWRAGEDHADAGWGTIYDPAYLQSNIAGGEGFDWYYAGPEAVEAQIRTPITDGAYGEAWVWRYKDIRSWWSEPHHERLDGIRQPAPTAWVPRSKPIWFTEYGCAAIDKGSNEPNRFLDVKSSESGLPRGSDGTRDDLIQMQYLRATLSHWQDVANNPVSPVYGGPMVDMARAHVWAWDARPYPHFPNAQDVWSDGENYPRGHWLNGRATNQSLAAVVADICTAAGLSEVDVSALHGIVRGYGAADADTARAVLQTLMLNYACDATERDGKLRFALRDGRLAAELAADTLAFDPDTEGLVAATRAPFAETAGRVRLTHIEADGDYEARTAEAIFPDEQDPSVAQSEAALVMTRAEGRQVVERWLAESRLARDTIQFALPPSQMRLGPGDVIRLSDDSTRYRIDRVELGPFLKVEGIRVEPAVYVPSDSAEELVAPRAFTPPVPTYPLFLDLPLLRGDEVPHAPHLAVTAEPWPGSVAVYSAVEDSGYVLNRLLTRPAIIGETETALAAAEPGQWDRGAPLRVRLTGGAIASAELPAVLNGTNLAAIGSGTADGWEVFQFAEARLVAPDTYEISMRLRGQAGTEPEVPVVWPAGSAFVLLDAAPQQILLAASERGLARHYRIGSATRSYDDPDYMHLTEAFRGLGLRPYAPAHLTARRDSGDVVARWVRRTRMDGDSWEGAEVPLGEDREVYNVRVLRDGVILRETEVAVPTWTYPAAMQLGDGAGTGFAIAVAQISDRFGAGPYTRIEVDG